MPAGQEPQELLPFALMRFRGRSVLLHQLLGGQMRMKVKAFSHAAILQYPLRIPYQAGGRDD
jgi:hypothetical protein